MSWSDDIRCLYCDGRLPLYRKITHGQFCSSAHRKKYWLEQENLAVERLRQTHDTLRAYVPAMLDDPALENPVVARVPDTAPASAPVFAPASEPVVAGHVPAAAPSAQLSGTPKFVAGDPLEYEMEVTPRHPASAVSIDFSGQLQLAGPVPTATELTRRTLPAEAATAVSIPYWSEPSGSQQLILRPHDQTHAEAAPAHAGPLSIPFESSPVGSDSYHFNAQPLFTRTRQAEYSSLALPQVSGELDRIMDQIPRPVHLFALSQFSVREQSATPKAMWTTALAAPAIAPLHAKLRADLPAPGIQGSAKRMTLALRSVPQATDAPAASGPMLLEPKSPVPQESIHTPASTDFDRTLPMASGVLYSVAPRIAPPPSVAQTTGLTLSHSSRRVELPPLLLEVGDSLGDWMLPPAHRIPFGNTAYVAPSANGPLKVLVLPQPLRTLAIVPASKLEPAAAKPAIEIVVPPPMLLPQTQAPAAAPQPAIETAPPLNLKPANLASDPWWIHASGFWKNGPRDLKLLLFGIPVLIALAFHPSLPKVRLSSGRPTLGISRAVQTQLASFRQSMAERAAVALDEDFRSGLDDWASRTGDATDWSYDATGFVKPGPLALYTPSAGLTDYQVQFLGMIGKKSMSWVVRAADFDNYYVIKLVERKGGSMPEIGVTRYAVIDGKAQDRVDTKVAISARPEMMYLVKMDVKGNDFSMWVQDQMVDSWSEPRLPRGGVGFYSAKGEESRLRWVQITHQYDMLGRLCAYLAPSNFSN